MIKAMCNNPEKLGVEIVNFCKKKKVDGIDHPHRLILALCTRADANQLAFNGRTLWRVYPNDTPAYVLLEWQAEAGETKKFQYTRHKELVLVIIRELYGSWERALIRLQGFNGYDLTCEWLMDACHILPLPPCVQELTLRSLSLPHLSDAEQHIIYVLLHRLETCLWHVWKSIGFNRQLYDAYIEKIVATYARDDQVAAQISRLKLPSEDKLIRLVSYVKEKPFEDIQC